MATKLQQLLDELKELPRVECYNDCYGYADYRYNAEEKGDLIESILIDQIIAKYTETTPTYKSGDSVRVIKCLYGHEFKIGEIIELLNAEDDGWFAINENDKWWVTEEEFEPIN